MRRLPNPWLDPPRGRTRHTGAEDLVEDLQALGEALQVSPKGRARFVIG